MLFVVVVYIIGIIYKKAIKNCVVLESNSSIVSVAGRGKELKGSNVRWHNSIFMLQRERIRACVLLGLFA